MSEGFGAGRFSQGRGRGGCRHCLSFHSTTLQLLYKCEVLWRSDTPTVAAISGTASAPQAFRGDASSRNEKSGNLASCLLVGGMLFRPLAIQYDVFPGHRGCDTPGSQKAPSAKRCIKTARFKFDLGTLERQKAPSAIRCIKTSRSPGRTQTPTRPPCQKAPSAKRCIKTCSPYAPSTRRMHGSESTERPKSRMQFPRARINKHQETAESQRSDFKT